MIRTHEGELYKSLYQKPTERTTLLAYLSHHPRALRDSVPYSQFLRIRRNCFFKHDFFREAETLKNKLLSRGYPRRLRTRSIKRMWYSPWEALLTPRVRVDTWKSVCVITFSPVSNQLKKTILRHWQILTAGDLSTEHPIFAFHKKRNIKDQLMRACTILQSDPHFALYLG